MGQEVLNRDPEGKLSERKRKENESNEDALVRSLLDGEGIPVEHWTISLKDVPAITHSVVEEFFERTKDKRHLREGYSFSKTKKFETSGKAMTVNLLPGHDMLFEGLTRPAMKQAVGISKGSGVYSCSFLLSKRTKKIIAAKDRSCAARKRGFCKHIAALAYKVVEAKMSVATELPRPISCTDVRQQWGPPSIKAQQDPEKEIMKRKPLHEIVFEKHLVTRYKSGGRKRKLPPEINSTNTSRPKGESAVDEKRVNTLVEELSKSKHQSLTSKFLFYRSEQTSSSQSSLNLTSGGAEGDIAFSTGPSHAQRSEGWFHEHIGKVTSSKAPAMIGFQGKKQFLETWDCVLNKKQEPQKFFKNFQRGIKFESCAVECFTCDSGAKVTECGMFQLERDQLFGASPDRIFQGDTCKPFIKINSSQKITLQGLSLLEVKTRAEDCFEPLKSVSGARVCNCQVQLQLECAKCNACILQSFVPETNLSRYFLITKDEDFIIAFLQVCTAVLDNKPFVINSQNRYANELDVLAGQVPNFENLIVLKQLVNKLAQILALDNVFISLEQKGTIYS